MMEIGRPPKYSKPEELQKKIQEYLNACPDTRKIIIQRTGETIEIPHPTITGLVLYCGFESRQSFYEYEKKPDFTYTIKRARTFLENIYEKMLLDNPTGAIFALKNFGWADAQQYEHSGTMEITRKVIE
jgi:hypothetical protein